MSNSKKILGLISLLVILVIGVYTMVYTYNNVPITYDGSDTDVTKLLADPTDYDLSDPDGITDIIVKTNLDKTGAVNTVAAILFDYRGLDTIGESFILLTAVAGSYVILSQSGKKKEGGDHE